MNTDSQLKGNDSKIDGDFLASYLVSLIWLFRGPVGCGLVSLLVIVHHCMFSLLLGCNSQQLLFEASEGGKTDNLRKLVSKCQEIGVSLNELLNLNSNKTESKNL